MSRLEEILQQEVAEEINAILAEADSRAEEILMAAKREAEELLRDRRIRIEAQVRSAARRAQSAAELVVSTSRSQAKGEIMEQVRAGALRAIEQASSRSDYSEILCALADEALAALVGANAVTSHPDDKERLGEWAAGKELELKTDQELSLGVKIEDGNGRTVENTLPERLRRAWDSLASEVAKRLWE